MLNMRPRTNTAASQKRPRTLLSNESGKRNDNPNWQTRVASCYVLANPLKADPNNSNATAKLSLCSGGRLLELVSSLHGGNREKPCGDSAWCKASEGERFLALRMGRHSRFGIEKIPSLVMDGTNQALLQVDGAKSDA